MDGQCKLASHGNKTDIFKLGNPYGGIPTHLITNLVGWVLLMALFLALRWSAFKFLRTADRQDLEVTDEESKENRLISVFFTDTAPGPEGAAPWSLEREQGEALLMGRKSFWSWLGAALVMGEERFEELAGRDAVQYLHFQRHLLVVLLLATLLCIGVVLPINFQGDFQGSARDFGHTTLANLDPESLFLYVHIGIAFVLFPITVLAMQSFSRRLELRDPSLQISHSLQVENIPKQMCQPDLLRKHFAEAYGDIEIRDVTIAYDVSKLTALSAQLLDATEGKLYGERRAVEGRGPQEMYPVCGARFCPCFCACCSSKVGVVEHFTSEEARLTKEVEREAALAHQQPLGIAFVSFYSIEASKRVVDSLAGGWSRCRRAGPPTSSLSAALRPEDWRVSFAPPPEDIYWENLTDQRRWLFLRRVVAGVVLLLVALFLTTPEYIVAQLDIVLIYMFGTREAWQLPSVVKNLIPTLLLWSFTALLPVLVAYSDRWLGHWYRCCPLPLAPSAGPWRTTPSCSRVSGFSGSSCSSSQPSASPPAWRSSRKSLIRCGTAQGRTRCSAGTASSSLTPAPSLSTT
jgi:hypothetical protein